MKNAISTLIGASVIAATSILSFSASEAGATTLNVTTAGSSGTLGDAYFQQVSDGVPAGTGAIDSFLRIQNNGTEKGYNTDYRPVQFDEKTDGNFTRSLLLGDVPTFEVGGVTYRQFILDLNEPNGGSQPGITLSKLQIFLGNAGDLNNYPTFDGDVTKIFDLGSGNSVSMTDLNSGSGRYDYVVGIKDSLFTGPNEYVYLYSEFTNAGGGFEEWLHREAEQPPVGTVPEPLTILGAGAAVAFGGGFKRKLAQAKKNNKKA
ncbi:PEP-CTERM sorting domain-containing protein [Crocosphaera sp. UHCC 0190]|uniref:PEP-CTERM sorting domain-containing protein n=1 Tax=Crocosphaera sp. UHCC 0190 TaxID=3110246 RepID=UPI002B1EB50B|nr:PEP-CTERM sorting domain-containing protein [Crocosphaera sp. UHCC 0190]MEA5511738.1 PEP-CTERM sorting domain-containing protein [Crocosphaera sp. UHCC 0190]